MYLFIAVQKMPCWCRFGHSETRIFKKTAWCNNWNEVAMSRGTEVWGGSAPLWSVFFRTCSKYSNLSICLSFVFTSPFTITNTLWMKVFGVSISPFYLTSFNVTLSLAILLTRLIGSLYTTNSLPSFGLPFYSWTWSKHLWHICETHYFVWPLYLRGEIRPSKFSLFF